jgi:hypothetical protein
MAENLARYLMEHELFPHDTMATGEQEMAFSGGDLNAARPFS